MSEKIKEAQQRDDQATKIVEKVHREETQDFTIEKGLLKKANKICILQEPELKE